MSRSAYSRHHFSMHASEEIRTAAAAYRAEAPSPGDSEVAERLEEAAKNAATREHTWQLAGYSTQEQTQLSECWWRNELAIARALPARLKGPGRPKRRSAEHPRNGLIPADEKRARQTDHSRGD